MAKYYVYELYNQYDTLIYYGHTTNPEQRLRQHVRGIANKNSKKYMYKMCREKKYTISYMNVIQCYTKKSVAKLNENYLTIRAIIEDSESEVLNAQIDNCLIFRHLLNTSTVPLIPYKIEPKKR